MYNQKQKKHSHSIFEYLRVFVYCSDIMKKLDEMSQYLYVIIGFTVERIHARGREAPQSVAPSTIFVNYYYSTC